MKQYEYSVHSQWGEDGILEEIFRRIGFTNRIAIDIGAWDGKHFSNTLNLAEQQNFKRILCEADETRAYEATQNFPDAQVFGRCESIDSILDVCKAPFNIDLCSIDIDGDDYYLWQDMVKYRPRVMVIGYNQTVPEHLDVKQERGGTFGASCESFYKLGREKGYALVHATVTNLIFVVKEVAHNFCMPLSIPNNWVVYTMVGYNGKRYQVNDFAHNDNQGGVHEKLITDVKYQPV